ncbi:sigma 54-interacting transcriptional regulator [Lucifera butyrica]|uniref:sigma 54-interacting transcriptional regulator n=1 Tax=Lucifera butyrica TaxID=1351585 RepID=UPI000F0330A7|nr:sigma 54-interacting transcriptional regulator [Lucifera butyrica]
MIKQLRSLIEGEDKKNPLTDEELAQRLGVGREKINELRQAADIPNYLSRREDVLLKAIAQLLRENRDLSYRKLVIALNKQGFQISSFGLTKYRKDMEAIRAGNTGKATPDIAKPPQRILSNAEVEKNEAFSSVVGYNGSLAPVIKLAKAAILYPQYGLHTMISGSTGVGKSQLVEEMHRFAQQVRSRKIPLVVFNCADYGDNPQLLVAQLFGYGKGSFTGAEADKAGLVEKANGGILFLDEIHRLPPKGQEILFRIMDKGEFSRLGETERVRKVNLMIIGATTEGIESSLLNTFRRRIPVTIQIPPLEGRPNSERLQLIRIFLGREAARINKVIQVPKEIMKLLLLYQCSGNIGQLKSDIQVICAKAFLNSLSGGSEIMKISLTDLPLHVKNQPANLVLQKTELDLIGAGELEIAPNSKPGITAMVSKDIPEYNIYQLMEKRMDELLRDHKSAAEAKQILDNELEDKIRVTTLSIENKYAGISTTLLQDIVGEELIRVMDDIKRILVSEMGVRDFGIINVLCLHLSAAWERLRTGKPIVNPHWESVRNHYKREFKIALKITRMLKLKLGLEFPEEEAGFIALYLNHFSAKERAGNFAGNVGLIVVTHGEVAKALIDIAQAIVGIQHGVAITMGMDEKVEAVLERVRAAAKAVNQGRGVLLLVDMGSLITFGELITEELGIPTRVIARVDTLLVMEAIRKSVLPSATLYTVYDSLVELGELFPRLIAKPRTGPKTDWQKTIVTTCFTGKGTALKIKYIIEEKLRQLKSDMEVIPLGLMGSQSDIAAEIACLQQASREIVLITGMINPHYQEIPFLPMEEVLNGEKLETLIANIKLRDELVEKNALQEECIPAGLKDLFHAGLVRVFHSLASKEEILNIMAGVMCAAGYVGENFYNDVMERESWGSSYIGNGVAIPHTGKTANIYKPGIGIAVIKNPAAWDEDEVSMVFMLALKAEHKDLFLSFYSLLKETDMVEQLGNLSDAGLIVTEVLNYVGKTGCV